MKNPLSIVYSSPDDRQRVVAEIWRDKLQLAEIHDDPGHMVIDFYNSKPEEPLSFKVEELVQVVGAAIYGFDKRKMIGILSENNK